MTDVVIRNREGRELFRFDEAYERNGILHGFVRVNDMDGARQILAQVSDTRPANGLRPRIVALCERKADAMRLRASGVWAGWGTEESGSNRDWIRSWQRGRPKEPGHALVGTTEPSASVDLTAPAQGDGGDGAPLLLCLGNDASPTLLALATHRPREAVVFYDETSPEVVGRAKRLSMVAGELPVGVLHFWPTDVRGSGIPRFPLERFEDRRAALANVTPGTKAQSWALAQLGGTRLCSLETKGKKVVWCQPGSQGEVPGTRWALPPTIVQADVQGGRLASYGTGEADLREQSEFLRLVARVVAFEAERDPRGEFFLTRHEPKNPHHSYVRVCEDETGDAAGQGGFLAEAVLRRRGEERRRVGTLPGTPDKGFWLEAVVGAVLLDADANDLTVGLRWDHLYELQHPGAKDSFRTDIDVVARFKGYFVGVSVKTGFPGTGDSQAEAIEAARQEIRAEARACLGRFAIPVLVRPIPKPEADRQRLWQTWREDRVLELPLSQLSNSSLIQSLFDDVVNDLQTTRGDA